MKLARNVLHALAAAAVLQSCNAPPTPPMPRSVLDSVASWTMQLQGLDAPGALRALEDAELDMVVLEPGDTVRGYAGISSSQLVARVRGSRGSTRDRKLCVAYLNIGQAEDYRVYWSPEWRAPSAEARGEPDFLLSLDPDGWPGNYPCKFWDPRWKELVFGAPGALLDRALTAGFDGCYLDWVLGYSDAAVRRAAERDGVDPARAMVAFLRELREYARRVDPDFFVIAQNGAELARLVPGFVDVVDGLAHEDLSFRGEASTDWDDPRAGGIDTHAERTDGRRSADPLMRELLAVRARGLPVFTIDYALRPDDVRAALRRSRAAGFVATVSRTPLDRVPAHIGRRARAQPSAESGRTTPSR